MDACGRDLFRVQSARSKSGGTKMSVFDLMAKFGEITNFLETHQGKFLVLSEGLPAVLDSWSVAILHIRETVTRVEESLVRVEASQQRIIAILDPHAITPEITELALTWAGDDPRNKSEGEGAESVAMPNSPDPFSRASIQNERAKIDLNYTPDVEKK
jgi:hypothetical protein